MKIGKQQDRFNGHPAICGEPADRRRKSTCGTTDDDILRRRTFQPDGIDNTIEEDREAEQKRCFDPAREPQQYRQPGNDKPQGQFLQASLCPQVWGVAPCVA